MTVSRKYWALAAATALVLSACSNDANELPSPSVETPSASATDNGEGTGEPVEGEETGGEEATDDTVEQGENQSLRADQVLEAISEALDVAYEERSAENVMDRVTGPARRTIEAGFENSDRFGTEVEPIAMTDADSTWSMSTDFPRVAMVFTENPDTGSNHQLVVLSQVEGRENYKLWGYADLVPADVEITFAADTQSIAKDDKEGIAAPAIQVVTEYAQLLSGDETNVTFEGDSLATSLSEQRESISESLGETGTASVNAEALDHGPMTMATEDGGAVTMGYFNYDVEIDRTSAGSTITVGDELAQWLTEEEDSTYDVQGTLTSTYSVMVAFYIPPQGGGNVQVIATSSPELIEVADDESTNPDDE
ncbi:hypothetical protein EJ997_06900 [Flaviflexus ciconiae]|uniref:DUF8094 domain-containing protein n=1 Tax=Flaviflexus ciconiae TaxID=2496867 RepID=A0A3Q9G4B9_9ACTO|nr:hypothetical protein [Flaviflexus ciconiae]AZQ77096.1 hypothetical protein EJ997_06900 [Flaviflexus ciconiae]